ncbi:MAG TPA: class I SAM-dependent methyltransferase [Anaerolineales bacterium]|nr:class I SAM-dependent methyltransferase [Anaerolineales bacterium]
MKILDIIHRQSNPKPWAEGEKIPWNDQEFSRRMLNEHLSQAHDAASRRFQIIDEHVSWIHNHVLNGRSTRILDLGCGPGLYTYRLASLRHQCVGIDFSPASIAYAREQAETAGLDCQYFLQDIRAADYGNGYGLVMSIFGEFNVFHPEEAKGILTKAYGALAFNGILLLEPHTFEKVVELGSQPTSWYSTEHGLFLDQPYLYLQENFWNAENKVAIQRYYIVDVTTGEVTCNSSSMQAYTNDDYCSLLAACGFGEVVFYPALGKSIDSLQDNLLCILSRKVAA